MSRRFIAGAVCPECQQLDKIVTFKQDGEDVAECVSCGYSSVRPKEEDIREQHQTDSADETGVVRILPSK